MPELSKEVDDSCDADTTSPDFSMTPPSNKDIAVDEAPATPEPFNTDPNVFPDGGWDAWLAVAGGLFTVFSSFGWINCKSI
jgi:hypothetical protein